MGRKAKKKGGANIVVQKITDPGATSFSCTIMSTSTAAVTREKRLLNTSELAPQSTKRVKTSAGAPQHLHTEAHAQTLHEDEAKAARIQTMSALMAPFKNHTRAFADAILAHHAASEVEQPCDCQVGLRTTRCRDCFVSKPSCDTCFVKKHRDNPFHWAEKWNGSFFQQCDISKLGGRIYIGHDGDKCPEASGDEVSMTIVTCNGIHPTKVLFCACKGTGRGSRWRPLLNARLYPASICQPTVAFSFSILELFDMLNVISKVSEYDFARFLRRLSSDSLLLQIPDIYDSLRRVMRLWRALRVRLENGQEHGIDRLLPHRPPGCVATRCPACPEPLFNVPHNLTELANEKNKHIYTAFHAVDGNFHLNRKKKVDDPDDDDLIPNAYFPNRDEYRKYLNNVSRDKEKSTCSNFAVMNQSPHKYESFAQTGVIAVKCRHDFYLSVVDMEGGGERFVIADHALAMALRGLKDHPYIIISYDIACQYMKRVCGRFKNQFPELADTMERVQFCVPKMHIQNHVEECMVRFSLNYTNGAGRFDGENPESGWAEINNAGPSTRQMNYGHRHEMLSVMFSDANFVKLCHLPTVLIGNLREAKDMLIEKKKLWMGLSEFVEPEQLRSWMEMSTEPFVNEDGEWCSVYKFATSKLPSRGEVVHKLQKQHDSTSAEMRREQDCTKTLFIDMGMKISALQRALRTKLRDDAAGCSFQEIESERSRLRVSITSWRREQAQFAPHLITLVSNIPATCDVEEEELFFPSFFNADERSRYELDALAEKEIELRQGEAFDILRELRCAIKQKARASHAKRKRARGADQHTRSLACIKNADAEKHKQAAAYCDCRLALLNLGVDVEKLGLFPLLEKDMYLKHIDKMHTLGDGKKTEGWIWTVGRGRGGADTDAGLSEWDEEAERVWWFRAKADMDRWQEEIDILEEEIRRTFTSFTRQARIWRNLVHGPSKPGHAIRRSVGVNWFALCRTETPKTHYLFPVPRSKSFNDI